MKAMSNKTIDEIQKRYQYKIDPLDNLKSAIVEYSLLFGEFIYIFKQYKFDENIMELKKKFKWKRIKLKKIN